MKSLLKTTLAALALSFVLAAPAAHAWQSAMPTTTTAQPITTGPNPEKMDAGSTDSELEGYRHSAVVKTLAGWIHQPVERTATIFEDLNSGVVLLIVFYFLAKYIPKSFRTKREGIGRDLADARSATALANDRLKAVEARLASLDSEIEALRAKSAQDAEADRKRIEASLETERARIVQSAEAEIAAAGAQAQRELKKFAAGIAVDRAASRIALTPEQDGVLIDDFTAGLGSELGRRN